MNDERKDVWSPPPVRPLPPLPPRSPFMPQGAEEEIRRNVERHYAQVNEIERLKTDLEHWKHRAELAEAEITVLVQKLQASEQNAGELKSTIATLHAQFDVGAQVWLDAYDRLRKLNLPHVTVITPPKLQALEQEKTPPKE
jgi:hypothetical protein